MDWPACFPNLNPIEHVWEELSESVSLYTTQHNTTLEEWVRIPQRYIQILINSMRCRCTACRDARGGATSPGHKILIRLNGANWKITVVSSKMKVNELLLKSVILVLDPGAFNARLFSDAVCHAWMITTKLCRNSQAFVWYPTLSDIFSISENTHPTTKYSFLLLTSLYQ